MVISRSGLAGCSDFSAATLDELVDQFRQWRDIVRETQAAIRRHEHSESGGVPKNAEARSFLRFALAELDGFDSNLSRLVQELPGGVTHGHVLLVRTMNSRNDQFRQHCIAFKGEVLGKQYSEVFADIYRETRGTVEEFSDFGNVAIPLETFVGATNSGMKDDRIKALEALELKPNIAGLGLNLNYLLGKLRRKFRR
jgi:hypothetical protein